jgi:hypothetical protein
MDQVLARWGEFERLREAFEQRDREAMEPVRAWVERALAERRAREQDTIRAQRALLDEIRAQLARDARGLLTTDAFREWLGALRGPADERGPKFLSVEVERWALARAESPLGLHRVERLERAAYNDEEFFRSALLVVEASLGDRRFFVGFETARSFALRHRERASLRDQIEYTAWDLEDEEGARLRCGTEAPRPTWAQVFGDPQSELAYQSFALARFAAPMLEASPVDPSFAFP